MTDDFDQIFGAKPVPRPSFTERLAGTERVTSEINLVPSEPRESTVGSGAYKPYGFLPTSNVNGGCDIQRWVDGTNIPEGIELQYRFLMQIGYVGEEQIKLFLPDCIVVVEGKHLRDLRKKLARRTVTFIQQFNSTVWSTAPVSGEALVERVEVVRP